MKQEDSQNRAATTVEETSSPIREDVVVRARKLLEDPDYPNLHVCRKLAEALMPMLT